MSNREFNDPLLKIALKAREAMQDPAKWCQSSLGIRSRTSCWFGHLLKATGYAGASVFFLNSKEGPIQQAMNIVDHLGFDYYGDLETFNDMHSHAEVLAEFDKGLAAWKQRLSVSITA